MDQLTNLHNCKSTYQSCKIYLFVIPVTHYRQVQLGIVDWFWVFFSWFIEMWLESKRTSYHLPIFKSYWVEQHVLKKIILLIYLLWNFFFENKSNYKSLSYQTNKWFIEWNCKVLSLQGCKKNLSNLPQRLLTSNTTAFAAMNSLRWSLAKRQGKVLQVCKNFAKFTHFWK